MTKTPMSWEDSYSGLAARAFSDAEICSAIVRLGKPFDLARIRSAAGVVSKYLSHDNFLVRHEAVWFLGCWGKIPEYLDQIIAAANTDEDVDNRAYAARCAGQILKGYKDASAIQNLLEMTVNEKEDSQVRLASYSALLYAYKGEVARAEATDFEPIGDKAVTDFDLSWLASLPRWVEELSVGTK